MTQKTFYITTPIYYPSANPHLGHSYSTVIADVVARYKRLQGYDVMFLTGTDEHGQKIEQNALKNNVTPKEFVDKISDNFKKLWEIMDISYDKFIRTTDDYHKKIVQKIFKTLYDKGKIYKGIYKGWYCTPCETFFTDSQLSDKKCPDCGRDVVHNEEEAYFFKLSEYSEKLLKLYEEFPEFIQPETKKNEMARFIKMGLEDLCVSRTSFSWGIPVDFDDKHVVYVWIDALSNYITALGYESTNDTNYRKFWPADVHIIGKEIARFHAIIWPAILMALDIPLPKQIRSHGWILFGDGSKMSKSKGNVIDPFILCERYGTDAVRYFLMKDVNFGTDGVFTNESLINRINKDLANDLGNLLSRVVTMIEKYFDGTLPSEHEPSEFDKVLIDFAINLKKTYKTKMDNFQFSLALAEVWKLISLCNKYVDETLPWDLAKDIKNSGKLACVLYNLCESLRIVSILISPITINIAEKIQKQIGAGQQIYRWKDANVWGLLPKNLTAHKAENIFPRIDIDNEIKELNKIFTSNSQKSVNSDKKTPDFINIEDFAKIQLKIVKILDCVPIKRTKKLLKLTVNDGEKDITVVSGIAEHYEPQELIGKNVVLVANLKPAKLCGIASNGMILAADTESGGAKVLFANEIAPGSKIR